MHTQNFDKELQTLSFLSECDQSIDAFGDEYERLLGEVKALEDRALRKARARALQKVMCNQLIFVNRLKNETDPEVEQ